MKDYTRFIFENRHFSKENNRVKHSAFVPWPHFETSVSNIESLDESGIWVVGDLTRENNPTARGNLNEGAVTTAGLSLSNAEPPPRHWHILGWDRNSKDAQKDVALILAPLTELHVR